MSKLYQMAKQNHEKYFDTAQSACDNASATQGLRLTKDQKITIVWHILDRLKSEGWIDERKQTKIGG